LISDEGEPGLSCVASVGPEGALERDQEADARITAPLLDRLWYLTIARPADVSHAVGSLQVLLGNVIEGDAVSIHELEARLARSQGEEGALVELDLSASGQDLAQAAERLDTFLNHFRGWEDQVASVDAGRSVPLGEATLSHPGVELVFHDHNPGLRLLVEDLPTARTYDLTSRLRATASSIAGMPQDFEYSTYERRGEASTKILLTNIKIENGAPLGVVLGFVGAVLGESPASALDSLSWRPGSEQDGATGRCTLTIRSLVRDER